MRGTANLAAIATPFGADGQLDLDAFGAHAGWLSESGLEGVFVAGTTGEGVLLESDEVAALVERAVAAGAPRVIAQVGRPSTRATVGLARRAVEAGAHAVAAYVPWFYPVTQVQLRRHFLTVLEAAGDVPAFMYNIPPRTGNDLDPALAGELAAAGFAGMKDSTGTSRATRPTCARSTAGTSSSTPAPSRCSCGRSGPARPARSARSPTAPRSCSPACVTRSRAATRGRPADCRTRSRSSRSRHGPRSRPSSRSSAECATASPRAASTTPPARAPRSRELRRHVARRRPAGYGAGRG